MKSGSLGINTTLMNSSRKHIENLLPVSKVDIYDGASKEFDPNGLFSPYIFGRIGSAERMTKMGYIDLKIPVFHPLVFTHLKRLKGIYVGIMQGTVYAKWDSKLKDFVRSDSVDGKTGFAFFVKHMKKIDYVKVDERDPTKKMSMQRELRIDIVKKYKGDLMRDTCLVIAAGVRDITVGEDNRTSYDEINNLYKKLIAISNTIVAGTSDTDEDDLAVHDSARWNLQYTMNEIYDYLFNIVFGKDKLIQSKWAGRSVFNGTRNVMTALVPHTEHLKAANTPGIDTTQVGVYQIARAMFPVLVHRITKGWVSEVIDAGSRTASVITPKTHTPLTVELSRKEVDFWSSSDGITKVLGILSDLTRRDKPIMVGKGYLGYIYEDEKGFRLVSARDIENENITKEQLTKCKPLTWITLLYCILYRDAKEVFAIITRYPVTGMGSTYPSRVQLRSTIKSKILQEYNSEWELYEGDEYTANELPILDDEVSYFDSMAVATDSLAGLGGDYDGDMGSFTIVYGKAARAEIKQYLTSVNGYLDPRGGARLKSNSDLVEWIARGMTMKK